ncbi:MAG: HEAT repeat domain-containing protein, partial [Gemmatimonadales bacterium]
MFRGVFTLIQSTQSGPMIRHSFVRSILRSPREHRFAGACVALLFVIGCDAGPSLFPAESIPVEAPERRVGEAFLDRAEIAEVLELQNLRDGAGISEWLEYEDSGVRARAAFALASVRDTGSVDALRVLLDDPAFEVRRDAAFALGHLRHDDDGRALLAALRDERESSVRLQLIESLGLRGGGAVIGELAAFSPADGESGALYLALARMGLRAGSGAPDVLLERLVD